jgi:hypothetical protein
MKSGNLNFLEPSWPLQACNGTALPSLLPSPCAVVMKSENLNFPEPSGPLQACNGTALPFYIHVWEWYLVCHSKKRRQVEGFFKLCLLYRNYYRLERKLYSLTFMKDPKFSILIMNYVQRSCVQIVFIHIISYVRITLRCLHQVSLLMIIYKYFRHFYQQ